MPYSVLQQQIHAVIFSRCLSDLDLLALCCPLEQSVERQVLHTQCRRLEAQNYNLSLTAEQLSHSMGVSSLCMRFCIQRKLFPFSCFMFKISTFFSSRLRYKPEVAALPASSSVTRVLLCLCSAGADVPATEASSRAGEAAGGAGALQEVFDAATDTLASKQPLQGLPTQVTPTCPPIDRRPLLTR